MFDSFPYESWLDAEGNLNQEITDFWTYGGHDSAGTYILTVLGIILMVVALIGWVWMEKQKLERQAAALRAAGAFAGGPPAAPQPGTTTE
jgi:predicted negative regulator of RcsB-dependent stress response